MLGRGNCGLLWHAIVLGDQLIRSHSYYARVSHAVPEAPVVLRADETFSRPFVVTPPHVPKREEVLHFV